LREPILEIGVRLDCHHFHTDAGLGYVRRTSTVVERCATGAWRRFRTRADT